MTMGADREYKFSNDSEAHNFGSYHAVVRVVENFESTNTQIGNVADTLILFLKSVLTD